MKLNKLSLSHRLLFEKYLSLKKHNLSTYSFANIFIWRKLFEIYWALIKDSLCVFFQDKISAFLYLEPLGKEKNPEVVAEAFRILAKLNKNPQFSHIENVEEENISFYQKLGFCCEQKYHEYILARQEIETLKGNRFKHKRASFNYFVKNFAYSYGALRKKDFPFCLELYRLWQKERKENNKDSFYQALLEDNFICLKEALRNYDNLGLKGVAVRIKDKLKAFSFGFELNQETFCILYEIADLNFKGLAQFIFSSFAKDLKKYRYLNIMDDSGLANLKKVKLSYRPKFLVPAYSVRKNVGEKN